MVVCFDRRLLLLLWRILTSPAEWDCSPCLPSLRTISGRWLKLQKCLHLLSRRLLCLATHRTFFVVWEVSNRIRKRKRSATSQEFTQSSMRSSQWLELQIERNWSIELLFRFAHGVGKSAGTAVAYFGQTCTYSTRHHLMSCLMWSDKQGMLENDRLLHKQKALLWVHRAIIFVYDNYQRGLKLQHQWGEYSSAFFAPTNAATKSVSSKTWHMTLCLLTLLNMVK